MLTTWKQLFLTCAKSPQNMHSRQQNTFQSDSQYRENVLFLLPPLILRLYTGCRLGQTLNKCITSIKKVKVLKMLRIGVLFISKTLPYSFCACVRNTPKVVLFVIRKMKLVSFSLFLDAPPPLDPTCPLHML